MPITISNVSPRFIQYRGGNNPVIRCTRYQQEIGEYEVLLTLDNSLLDNSYVNKNYHNHDA